MGTPEPAAKVLESLISSQHEIACVVTQPDRPKGRGQKITFSPVKELAVKHGLPLEQPEKVKKNQVFVSLLKSLKPDIIIVVAYGRILPKEILGLPKFGCVNIHASLLPKYRGAAPIQWALLNGEKETGLTIMQLNEGLDTGDIIKQEKVFIDEDDTTPVLTEKLFKRAGNLLRKALAEIEAGKTKLQKQDDAKASYASLITKEAGEIDWKKSAAEIHNRVRAMIPWPVARTFYKGKLLKIWQTKLHIIDLAQGSNLPGTIIEIVKNVGFIVATGKGHLLVTSVQLEGKKRMPAYNFVIGHDVKIAETLPN